MRLFTFLKNDISFSTTCLDTDNILKDNFSCWNPFKVIKLHFYRKVYIRLIVLSKNLCEKSKVSFFFEPT